MIRTNLLAGLLALALFVYAQYQGWSVFEQEAGAATTRASGGGRYHK